MTKLLSFIALLLCATAPAQTEKDLYGKWQFASIEKFDGPDSEKQLMLTVLSGMAVTFNENRSASLSLAVQSYSGTWSFNSKTKKVVIANKGKEVFGVEILGATASELRVRQSPSLIVKLKRADAQVLNAEATPATIPASIEQLTGNWEMNRLTNNGKENALPPLLSGSVMKLNADGTVSGKLMGMSAAGRWEIVKEDGADCLKVITGSSPMLFYIIGISTTTLQLQAPGQNGVVFGFIKKQ
ncbi:MAG: hypothetical protein EOO01_30165 [Chitinophagaceae bacterium]|nr:MAG: hypothetical protein EOO01_30165 [Chitinophagaceae bacterium]